MAKILGIIGGGQLGMMLTEAAQKMPEQISKVIVLDPTENCPASKVGALQIVADFKDKDAIIELAAKSDIITYEIESGDSDILQEVEKNVQISPPPQTLAIIQDKFLQKSFLLEHGIPVSEFVMIQSMHDLREGVKKFGYPVLLKSRRDGYDGHGNFKINSESELDSAFNYFDGKGLFLEKFVDFKMEVSVIAARTITEQIKTYPLVENIHKNNILHYTIAPARISDGVAKKANQIAEKIMSVIKGAGVFGIEMFVTRDDNILINEIAPRVHNSGHYTLESCKTSQFEQHLRSILGMNLGDTSLACNTVMGNILGSDDFQGEYKSISISDENVFLKMYGKKISKPSRKLGHFNIVGNNGETLKELLEKLEILREKIILEPADTI